MAKSTKGGKGGSRGRRGNGTATPLDAERAAVLASLATVGLDDLGEENYSTQLQRSLRDLTLRLAKPQDAAQAFMEAFVARDVSIASDEGMAEAAWFAGFLVFLAGREVAEKAFAAVITDDPECELPVSVHVAATFLGFDPEPPPDADPFPTEEILAEMAGALDQGETGAWNVVVQRVAGFPPSDQAPMVEALFERARGHEHIGTFATLVLLWPGHPRVRSKAIEFLARTGGRPAHDFLGRLTAGDVGPDVLAAIRRAFVREHNRAAGSALPETPVRERKRATGKALSETPLVLNPLDWEVTEAFATAPDGQDSQELYLVRRRPDGSFAVAGAIFCPDRGVADGHGGLLFSQEEVDTYRAEVRDASGEPFPVRPEYVIDRIREGEQIAAAAGIPLPFWFQHFRYLFAGLWSLPAVDVGAAAELWARPDQSADRTVRLLSEDVCASWFLREVDCPGLEALAKTVRVLEEPPGKSGKGGVKPAPAPRDRERLIAESADWLLTPLRERLARRLEHLAYLLDRTGRSEPRDLAATAGRAMRKGSGIRLADQAFALALLDRSIELGVSPS